MLISYNWLKNYVDVKVAPKKLAELLTMSGLAVESIETKGGDSIFEIDVTSNRPDCLSVVGVAREVAAITGKKLNVPYIVHRTSHIERNKVSISVCDKKLCPRYTARVIEGVKVADSPKWLKERLEAIGLRPVNNIVDITNFCLFELGEPMHAFDLDKLSGRTIIVRRVAKGEKIRTIDGVERILDEDILVIADAKGPVAIAGVMGGLDTEVRASTKNILLEAAIFDPISTRRASRKLGIPTESSYRFERRIDPKSVLLASGRACELILKEAGGIDRGIVDIGADRMKKKPLTLNYSRLNCLLGIDVPAQKAKEALTALGFRIRLSSKDSFVVEAPSFRQDIGNETDLIEEVIRVYGYDKIPVTLPNIPEGSKSRLPQNRIVEDEIRKALAALGLHEILTYSLVNDRDASWVNPEEVVRIANPLSNEQGAMRPSLIPGLLKTAAWNINRKAKEIGVFEIGNVYINERGRGAIEKRHVSIGLCGLGDFFDLKGILEALTERLGIPEIKFRRDDNPPFEKRSSAGLYLGSGVRIGAIGEVSRDTLDKYDIKEKVYALEAALNELYGPVKLYARYKEPPRHPNVVRDISIVVDGNVECGKIMDLIKTRGGALVNGVELIDRFTGKQIPEGKVGLTYRIEYQDTSKTLEDSRVSAIHSNIFNALASELGASMR